MMSDRENRLLQDRAPSRRTPQGTAAVLTIALGCGLALGCRERDGTSLVETPSRAAFIGGTVCAGCHAEVFEAWRGSHHDLAMQPAVEGTVLGDFDAAVFEYAGVTSTFFRRDGRHFVRTDGPDGALADYEVAYTFGVMPLQQYLLALPGGRLQALSIAWDARPAERGGQRWFHLYPGEKVTHDDELHWTRLRQNWNMMCAECHSTDLRKNYDASRREYDTTWSEMNVACEACHGPGSEHVAWAARPDRSDDASKGLAVLLNERDGIAWIWGDASPTAARSTPRVTDMEIRACAPCHSRRVQFFDDALPGAPLMDAHLPALLTERLYHADGRIDGEVYEHGSFLQSRMYHEGVTCSDCHDPHTLRLRAPGQAVCATCHRADVYESVDHHHHEPQSTGASCIACHMPETTYMVIDPRHDHAFRVPRPDLSARIGIPNACNDCHTNRSAPWAAEAIRSWLGREAVGFQGYAETLHAGRSGGAGAGERLAALARDSNQPAIARATAVVALRDRLVPETFGAIVEALQSRDPMLRAAALTALDGVPQEHRRETARALLDDPVRVVRILAAETLAGTSLEGLALEERALFDRAAHEYVAALSQNADDPSAQVNLGNFHAALEDPASSERAYREALALDPFWEPAYVNLADLMRRAGREAEGEAVLNAGLAVSPASAALHHALGLLYLRRGNPRALDALGRAAELDPGNPRFGFVHALALHEAGRMREALAVVEKALARSPGDPSLSALRTQLLH